MISLIWHPSCLTMMTSWLLTHWGRVTHICVGNLTIIGSNNGLSPGQRLPLGTNFREILIEIHSFSFKKMHLKMSSRKWRPFCLGLNVLNTFSTIGPLWGASSCQRWEPVSGGLISHDVIKWEQFSRYWPLVRGIHRSLVNSCTKVSDAGLWYLL